HGQVAATAAFVASALAGSQADLEPLRTIETRTRNSNACVRRDCITSWEGPVRRSRTINHGGLSAYRSGRSWAENVQYRCSCQSPGDSRYREMCVVPRLVFQLASQCLHGVFFLLNCSRRFFVFKRRHGGKVAPPVVQTGAASASLSHDPICPLAAVVPGRF